MATRLILRAGWRVQANYLATIELVFCFDHAEFACFHGVANDLTVRQHIFGALMYVFLDCRFDQIVCLGVGLGLSDRRIDLLHDRVQVNAGHLFTGTRGIHRTALLMSQHDQQRTMKMVHSILNASESYSVSDVPCSTYHEDVSQALVENQLWTNSAVGTREDDRLRRLSGSQLMPQGN